jgi:hypothetical protein
LYLMVTLRLGHSWPLYPVPHSINSANAIAKLLMRTL